MTANPIELVGGLANTSNVVKGDLVAWAKARVPQVFASATEVRNTVLAGQLAIKVLTTKYDYALDTLDTTTADDGISCIISSDGKRFKILRGVTAAADLSDGTTGTGAIVLANAPSITGVDLGIFSSGVIDTSVTLAANSDLKLATQKAVKSYVAPLYATPFVIAAGIADVVTFGNTAFPNALTINSQGDICVGGYSTPDATHHLSFEILRNQNTDAALTLRNRNNGSSARGVLHMFAGVSDQVDVGLTVAAPAAGGNVNLTAGGTTGGFNIIVAANDIFQVWTNNTPAFHVTGGGIHQFDNTANFSANGSVATSLGSVGPTGARTTVQKWLKILDPSGNPFWLALF